MLKCLSRAGSPAAILAALALPMAAHAAAPYTWSNDMVSLTSQSPLSNVPATVRAIRCDGMTDDTAGLLLALEASGAGGSVTVMGGKLKTCIVRGDHGLHMVRADQTFRCTPGVVLKAASGQTTNIFEITAANVTIRDCELDGNRTRLTSDGSGIIVNGASGTRLSGLKISHMKTYGIYGPDARDIAVSNIAINDTGYIGLLITIARAKTDLSGVLLTDIVCDRTNENARTIVEGCVKIHGVKPHVYRYVVLENVRAALPLAPPGDSVIGIEANYVSGLTMKNLQATGGYMGVSQHADNSTLSGATIRGAGAIGLELSGGNANKASAIVVDGEGRTINGVFVDVTGGGNGTPKGVSLSDLQVSNTRGSALKIDHGLDIAVSSATIKASSGQAAIEVVASKGVSITGGTLDGLSAGTKGVFAQETSGLTVSGTVIRNFREHGVMLAASTPVLLDDFSLTANRFENVAQAFGSSLSGGARLGRNLVAKGNAGLPDRSP